jgi:hypothetical protein
MTLPLETAVDALWQAIRPAAGVSVTYTQGQTTLTVYAVPGSTPIEVQTVDGVVRTDKTQDFVFQVSDLLGVVPQRGDTVVWDDRNFEVIQPAGGRCYSFSDQYQRMIRVHAKEVYGS